MKLNSRELLVVLEQNPEWNGCFSVSDGRNYCAGYKKKKRIGRILQKKENCRDIGQKKRRMNIVRMKIKKWLAAFTVAAGMVLPARLPLPLRMKRLSRRWKHLRQQRRQYRRKNRRRQRKHLFSVPGNGSLADDKSGDSTKEFLTVQTKNGNTFFLVLDRSSNKENVYMLP